MKYLYDICNYKVNIETNCSEDICGFNLKFGIFFMPYTTENLSRKKFVGEFKVIVKRCSYKEWNNIEFEGNRIDTTFKASQFYITNKQITENYKSKIIVITKMEYAKSLVFVSPDFDENKNIVGSLIGKHFSYYLCENDIVCIHASSASNKKHSIIFSGLGGSGKSTIVCIAKNVGYHIVSDDKLPIDVNNNMLWNCLSSIGFDKKSIISPLNTRFHFLEKNVEGEKTYFYINNSDDGIKFNKIENNILIFPMIVDDKEPCIYDIGQEEAYRLLLRSNSYNVQVYPKKYCDTLMRLAQKSKAYKLFLNRSEESVNFIEKVLLSERFYE